MFAFTAFIHCGIRSNLFIRPLNILELKYSFHSHHLKTQLTIPQLKFSTHTVADMQPAPDINAKQVICDALPKLRIGKFRTETITTPTMEYLYRGPLARWDAFPEDVGAFFETLQPAFLRCQYVAVDKSQDVAQVNPDFATGELLQMGSEIDIDGRFKHNVCTKLIGVLRTLHNPRYANGKAPTDLPDLPRNVDCGSNKVYNFANKPAGSEPDVVFKIPGMGERRQEVRLLCELKSPSVVTIATMTKAVFSTTLRTRGSFRNLIGQVVRDMLAWRLKYGAVSTYNETVFLKIDQSRTRPGEWGVYYTKIVNSTDEVCVDSSDRMSTMSTRLAFLYLLHRVNDKIREHWKLPADLKPLRSGAWIGNKFDDDPCPDVTPQSDSVTHMMNTSGIATLNLGRNTDIQQPKNLIPSQIEGDDEDDGDEADVADGEDEDDGDEGDVSLYEPDGFDDLADLPISTDRLRSQK